MLVADDEEAVAKQFADAAWCAFPFAVPDKARSKCQEVFDIRRLCTIGFCVLSRFFVFGQRPLRYLLYVL